MYTLTFISYGIESSLTLTYEIDSAEIAEQKAKDVLSSLFGTCYGHCDIFLNGDHVKSIRMIVNLETEMAE